MMLKQPAAELMSPYHWLKCKLYFINIFYKQKTEIILFPFFAYYFRFDYDICQI